MPKSLRCKIKKLCYNGALTERERDRILKALDQEEKICGNCKYGCSIKPEDHICGECSRYYDDLYEKKEE